MKLATIEESGVWPSLETIDHRYMTCVNHPTARYVTKNPFSRTLHFTRPADGFKVGEDGWTNLGECPCPFSDLRVIMDEETSD